MSKIYKNNFQLFLIKEAGKKDPIKDLGIHYRKETKEEHETRDHTKNFNLPLESIAKYNTESSCR